MPPFQQLPPKPGEPVAVMETSFGAMKFRLFPDDAKKTVENFAGLAGKGYYDGISFHRVIEGFMAQGGDPTGTGMGGESLWGREFEDEFSPRLRNVRGALSMANAGKNTNGSQFFIVHAKAVAHLDGVHSVFGQIYEGTDVLDRLCATRVDRDDRPLVPAVIKSVRAGKYGEAGF